jgi:hypothetical protein
LGEKKMKFATIILIMVISSMVFGCNAEGKNDQAPAELQEAKVVSSPLSGTCATGRSCTTPSCGQYVDANQDSACDRGFA